MDALFSQRAAMGWLDRGAGGALRHLQLTTCLEPPPVAGGFPKPPLVPGVTKKGAAAPFRCSGFPY